jgi:hypothetical protein
MRSGARAACITIEAGMARAPCPLFSSRYVRLRDGSVLRASRTYMPALAEALHHLNKKTA